MSGAIPPLPNMPSWRGAQSTGTTLPLYPLDRRRSGPQSWPGRGEDGENCIMEIFIICTLHQMLLE
jgi:hypothetical protein